MEGTSIKYKNDGDKVENELVEWDRFALLCLLFHAVTEEIKL